MPFKNLTQEEAYTKVGAYLSMMFGAGNINREGDTGYSFMFGSARIVITVYPWKKDNALVDILSFVVSAATRSPELMAYLLEINTRLTFGSLSLNEKNSVLLHHALVGKTFDRTELEAAVQEIARIADDYDDEIVSRFGGKRAEDK